MSRYDLTDFEWRVIGRMACEQGCLAYLVTVTVISPQWVGQLT